MSDETFGSFAFTPQTRDPPFPAFGSAAMGESTATPSAKFRDNSGAVELKGSLTKMRKVILVLSVIVLPLLGVWVTTLSSSSASVIAQNISNRLFLSSGHSILSTPAVYCLDEALSSAATCSDPIVLTDRTVLGKLRTWTQDLENDLSTADYTRPNLLPGYKEIMPHLKIVRNQTENVSNQFPYGYLNFRSLQRDTQGAVEDALYEARWTYFARSNPSSLNRFIDSLLGGSDISKQRMRRAEILTDFTRTIIKHMEKFQKDPWWFEFGSWITVLRDSVTNVQVVSFAHWNQPDYYSRQTCQTLSGKDKCNAIDIVDKSKANSHLDDNNELVALVDGMEIDLDAYHGFSRLALKDMKHMAGKIETALLNATSGTMLDTPEAFTRFVWSFASLTRFGIDEMVKRNLYE